MEKTRNKKILFLVIVIATFLVLFPQKSQAIICCICRNPQNQLVVSCPELPAGETSCRIYEQYPQNLKCGNPVENCETRPECRQWYQTGRGSPEGVPGTAPSEVVKETPYQPRPMIVPILSISIPGLIFTSEENQLKICTACKDAAVIDPADCPKEKCLKWAVSIPWIGEYISAFYKWAVGALAVLAVIMIMVSGIRWLIAGGSPEKISSAKQGIVAAVSGLIFILIVNQVLAMINPELVIFKPIVIGMIKREEFDFSIIEAGADAADMEATPVPPSPGASPSACIDEKILVKIDPSKFGGVSAAEPKLLPETYQALLNAQNLAKQAGKSIYITSAFRSLSHQKKLWERAVKKYGSESAAARYVARPRCGAPHLTGGAVDVCLAGTSSCGQISAKYAKYSSDDIVALQNFMTQAGFVRYCGEWWHFEYGTKRWESGKNLPPGPGRCKF